MVESGVWGRAHARVISLDASGLETALPLGGLRSVSKVYLYLNADAVLLINGRFLRMQVTRQGFWEFLADAQIHSLAIWTEGICAQGKYCVFGQG